MDIPMFLKEEIKKPLRALKCAVIYSAKWIALSILRGILWAVLFCLPVLMFLLSGFHLLTNRVRDKVQAATQFPDQIDMSSPATQAIPESFRNLSYDVRFWKREFEKWRK